MFHVVGVTVANDEVRVVSTTRESVAHGVAYEQVRTGMWAEVLVTNSTGHILTRTTTDPLLFARGI